MALHALLALLPALWGISQAINCTAIPPQTTPSDNDQAIATCLQAGGVAILSGGLYLVTGGIAVPNGGTLSGNQDTATIVQLTQPSSTNYLVSPGSSATVSYISFDANEYLPDGCCSAVFLIGAVSNVLIHDCSASGQDNPGATGVYFISAEASNNMVLRVNISAMQYGVIFLDGLLPGSSNVVQDSFIFENHCDSVTFAGFGELRGCTIQHNGWDCKNGNPPIPGGGPYCLDNTQGAIVQGNVVSENCGMLFDIDSCSNFIVDGNTFMQPGYTWGGLYPYCQGSLAVNLIDTSSFSFTNNQVQNTLNSNAVGLSYFGDSNGVFGNEGASAFSDLPNGPNTVLALTITTRPASIKTTSNVITNNTLIAGCTADGCAGVGYFSSRGTGFQGKDGAWAPNMYTGNSPFGSDVGSKRCGGNWYAGNTPVCDSGSPYPCNEDDYQHPDVSNWRNDPGCAEYT
jgi:hypothetical protein